MKNIIKRLLGSDGNDNSYGFGITDPGQHRKNNEDAFKINPNRDIFIVADGMGGHNAGEVAAAQAIQALDDYFTQALVEKMRTGEATVQDHMERAFLQANSSIYEMGKGDSSMDGMGCTLIMALITGNTLHTCHVGDVRCYVCSSTGIDQIGSDHSQVWDLVRAGRLSPEEARRHQLKNILTQAVGQRSPIAPEYHSREVHPDERVLLCSDGLWDMLTDEEIHTSVMKYREPKAACLELVERANNAGGRDNITVVVFLPRSKKQHDAHPLTKE